MKEINTIYIYIICNSAIIMDMSMVIMDSDMIIQQVSLRQTWCLILSLVSVWNSPFCDMSVCPLLTSGTTVFSISC